MATLQRDRAAVQVPVRELKDHLSAYLRRAQAGEEVVITSHGRPVGRLLGPRLASRDLEAEAVPRLRELPFVRPPRAGKVRGSAQPIQWQPGEPTLADLLLEDRE
jgi:prevent-host-death family protein